MARIEKYDKDYLLKKGVEFVRLYGLNSLNARSLAHFMSCSTQPLFRNYSSISEYKKDLKKEMKKNYNSFINKLIDPEDYLLTISYAYALYAKEEPNLFYALFVSELTGSRTVDEVINSSWNRATIESMPQKYHITLKQAEELYRDTRFYTHGIATQLCAKSIILSNNEIKNLIASTITKLRR